MNTNIGILIAVGLGTSMLLLGNLAEAGSKKTERDPVSSALNAISKWSTETGKGGEVTLGVSSPGMDTDLDDGEVVIDVTPSTIRFLQAENGTLVSAPELAAEFQRWLAKHPELVP